jgi:hypothetical protein
MSRRVSERSPESLVSRRSVLRSAAGGMALTFAGALLPGVNGMSPLAEQRSWVKVRGMYGGFLAEILAKGEKPADYGINAIWVGSGSLNVQEIDRYHQLGLKVFAEFNSMHAAEFLQQHPDAAPVGADGERSPAPSGWQGVSPFHAGYRRNRMDEFRRVLSEFAIDGIWLDYHHSHASWEQAEPQMPDTDFCPAALQQFAAATGIALPEKTAEAARLLLSKHRDAWTDFRCQIFTDWVREYREILNATRPSALLGTFHCPWSQNDRDGAIRHKLAIDLKAQEKYLDVFSIMPYHARFGHADDIAWIARQTKSLGEFLGLKGTESEAKKIWPILQMSDWGEPVTAEQAAEIIEAGTRPPATGVMVFHWNGLAKEWNKVTAIGNAYRSLTAE